jgi:hypothetical protein
MEPMSVALSQATTAFSTFGTAGQTGSQPGTGPDQPRPFSIARSIWQTTEGRPRSWYRSLQEKAHSELILNCSVYSKMFQSLSDMNIDKKNRSR